MQLSEEDDKMNKTFSQWLLEMLKDRAWSQAELARRSGLSRTAISDVISEKAKAGNAFCRSVASAFHVPVDDVYRAAGLLPTKPEHDEKVSEIDHIYHELDDDNRQDLLEYARSRLLKQGKNAKDKHRRPPSSPS
jgi:transcriptional regulator with XRE-family HTH domain